MAHGFVIQLQQHIGLEIVCRFLPKFEYVQHFKFFNFLCIGSQLKPSLIVRISILMWISE